MLRIHTRVIGPGVLIQDGDDPRTCPLYIKPSARKALGDLAPNAILPDAWQDGPQRSKGRSPTATDLIRAFVE